VIDNSPAPSRLVNADALGEELKFYPRRSRLKSARPGQARHFATHTQGLFRVDTVEKGILRGPLSNIDSKASVERARSIQKFICSDSIVSNSNSTALFWILFQHYRSFAPIWPRTRVRLSPDSRHNKRVVRPTRCATSGREQSQQKCYSITSSARTSTACGTSRPSALAVLRLSTSWYLVGACTGRSAGFSPLRTRST
jgi:hypothetical protein